MQLKVLFLLAIAALAQCTLIDLSCQHKRAFVDGHNSRRLLVAKGLPGQPAASEMKMMMWDDELQAKASKWVVKNRRYHNPDKSVPSGKFTTGENLYWYFTTSRIVDFNPDTALESWFSEHENFTFGPLTRGDFDGSKDYNIGHYTQMVWSDSVYLGCAIARTTKDGWYQIMVVCNYGPGGNYLGRPPYKTDGGASKQLICGVHDCSRLYGNSCPSY